MTKSEFLTRLEHELRRRNVADAADVMEEYEQHFAFKLAITPQFVPKKKRQLRTTALIALLLFAVCFVLAYVVCALSARSVQFWHVWDWFQN